jgi:putative flippase GtrA
MSIDFDTHRLASDISRLKLRALETGHAPLPQLSRYAVVSALALGLDFAVFLSLNAAIGHPTLSGVAGYACGIALHYQLSRHFVFAASGSGKSAHRRFGEFVASGLVGLMVTAVVMAAATGMGVSPIVAKIAAAGASFIGVYVIRRAIVFA